MGVLDGKRRSEDQLYEEAARLEIEEEVTSREETIAQSVAARPHNTKQPSLPNKTPQKDPRIMNPWVLPGHVN